MGGQPCPTLAVFRYADASPRNLERARSDSRTNTSRDGHPAGGFTRGLSSRKRARCQVSNLSHTSG